MKIKVKDLIGYEPQIKIDHELCGYEIEQPNPPFSNLPWEAVVFYSDDYAKYCPVDMEVELDEYGRGRLNLYVDYYEEVDLEEQQEECLIQVSVVVPFTEHYMTKKLIGGT